MSIKFSSLTNPLCLILGSLVFASVFAADIHEEQKPRILMVKVAPQKIVVSLKPYALLLENIMREGNSVTVLVEDGSSGHDFQLRPSHLKKIAEADLVIWSGAEAEPNLAKVLKNKKHLVLMEVPGLDLININEDNSDHKKHTSHTTVDSHIWFSQHNALIIAQAMAKALHYPDEVLNNINMRFKLMQAAEQVEKNQSNKRELIVYHNGYRYLEKDMNVQHSFVINESHNSKPGLRHWHLLKEKLLAYKKSNQSLCIVTLPGFEQSSEAKQLAQLLNDSDMTAQTRLIEIDPLASTARYKDYFEFYADSKNKLLSCMRE